MNQIDQNRSAAATKLARQLALQLIIYEVDPRLFKNDVRDYAITATDSRLQFRVESKKSFFERVRAHHEQYRRDAGLGGFPWPWISRSAFQADMNIPAAIRDLPYPEYDKSLKSLRFNLKAKRRAFNWANSYNVFVSSPTNVA